jgi:hypothetical protein
MISSKEINNIDKPFPKLFLTAGFLRNFYPVGWSSALVRCSDLHSDFKNSATVICWCQLMPATSSAGGANSLSACGGGSDADIDCIVSILSF